MSPRRGEMLCPVCNMELLVKGRMGDFQNAYECENKRCGATLLIPPPKSKKEKRR